MKTQNRSRWKQSTQLAHSPEVELPEGNLPIVPPIYQSAKFSLTSDVPIPDQYLYTRISNPSLHQLELSLSEILNKEESIVFGSGIAAITGTLLSLLKQGDHIIFFREVYRPSRIFIRETLPRFGIDHSMLKLCEADQLEKHIVQGKTKIIYFESPTNPHLQIADIKRITEIARKHGIITLFDGTFAGIHQHTQCDLDLIVHSLTKYANGHGDVVAGSVSGRKDLIKKIRQMSQTLGSVLDPHAAFLISRGLKTYLLRYERQCQTALTLAQFLKTHPQVKKVYYPGLSDHPQHRLALEQMSDMGGILAFEIDPACGTAMEFCYRMKLFQFTASVGSTESLICPSLQFFGDDLEASHREEMGLTAWSLRISVGLEDAGDLIQDLSSGFEEVGRG